jgi:hypothetical protein
MAGNWARINFRVPPDCDVEALRRLLSEAARATTTICHEISHDRKRHIVSLGIPCEPNQIALLKAGTVLGTALDRAPRELSTHWISLHDDTGGELAAPCIRI